MPNPYPIKVATADGIVSLDGEATFTDPANQPGGGGGSQPLIKTSIAFNTANLDTGVTFWTAAVDSWLLNAWFLVTAAFDGTTPQADFIAVASNDNGGTFNTFYGPVDLTQPATAIAGGILFPSFLQSLVGAAIQGTSLSQPVFVPSGTVYQVVAAQDGLRNGAAIDSTAGAADLVLQAVAA